MQRAAGWCRSVVMQGAKGGLRSARTRYRCVSGNGCAREKRRRCGIPSRSYAKSSRMVPICCDAGSQGRFEVGTDTLSVRVGKRMRAGKEEEMWDSVQILCKEQPDGADLL